MNEKLKRFALDKTMNEAVYDVLRQFFLKKRGISDVQMLATERLALFLLEEAWRDVQKYGQDEKKKKNEGNVGL
jgi:hypothetical protein